MVKGGTHPHFGSPVPFSAFSAAFSAKLSGKKGFLDEHKSEKE
jgi:hypothetical protein